MTPSRSNTAVCELLIAPDLEGVIPGVFLIPQVLSPEQIAAILEINGSQSHHEEEGHHGGGGHNMRQEKPDKLPYVAELIWPQVSNVRLGTSSSCGVDSNMKLYRLKAGGGVVARHVDQDFEGPDQSVALCSILMYLNGGYTGGATLFNGAAYSRHIALGGGLLFRHDIPHEGLMVESGEKIVLKTDLFFRN